MKDPTIIRALRSLSEPEHTAEHIVVVTEPDVILVELPPDLQEDIQYVIETRQAERIQSIFFTPDQP